MANNVDPAIKYTDDEIKELDKKIKDIYSEAESDIQKKMDDFTAKHQKKDIEYQKQLKEGKITQTDYDAWKKGQVFTGKQWKAKKDEMSAVLHNSNKIATSMVNKSMFSVFSENGNYMAYSIEHNAGVNFGFGLYNTEAVTRLIKDDPEILPKWNVNAAKDYVWNQQNLNRAITQGIIQGESLDKISKRVSTGLAAKNENLMKTFAKTGMTEAQNAGRLERMREGKALGIDVKKKWVAVLDERTRINHRELDGQIIDIEEPFEVGGLKIMYPGDKTAHPSMVYNCRCKLDETFPKYPSTYQRYDNVLGQPIDGMSYNEWKNLKVAESEVKGVASLFSKMRMSPLYYAMRDLDSKLANQFYKELGKYGKPSDVWTKYLSGQLDDSSTTVIDDILTNYATKKDMSVPGAVTPSTTNFRITYKDKKMSQMYNDIKAYDTKLANQFYKELGAMGKPSDVWVHYLNGTLDPTDVARIEKYLNQFSSSKIPGTIAPTVVPKPVTKVASTKPVALNKKWIENNIDDKKFLSSSKFDANTKKEMVKQLDKTSDAYKKNFIGALDDINEVAQRDPNYKSYYDHRIKSVNIDLERKQNECQFYENPLHVFFHEMGHAIDQNATYGNKVVGGWLSYKPEFKEAFRKDIDLLNNRLSLGANEIKKINKLTNDDESRGIQDVFSSLRSLNEKGSFKGKINSNHQQLQFYFQHSKTDYWDTYNDPATIARSELFAHISAAQTSAVQQKYMKEYFPNCFDEFTRIIEGSRYNK